MLVSEINLDKTSSQQVFECTVYETQTSQLYIDCYPYAMRGLLWGLFFSIIFWGSVIGVLMLLF